MLNRLTRIVTHRWHDETDVGRAFDPAVLARLERHVAVSEQGHRGEIRLSIESGLPMSYLWRGATARERAVTLFGKLRVWDTELNNGVLVYVLLAERRIELVADRGIARRVPPSVWQDIAQAAGAMFARGAYEDGMTFAVARVDALLREHFPLAPGQTRHDELPNAPHVL